MGGRAVEKMKLRAEFFSQSIISLRAHTKAPAEQRALPNVPTIMSTSSILPEQFLEAEDPDRDLVAEVLKVCCRNYRYQFSQFKAVYAYTKAGRSCGDSDGIRAAASASPVEYKGLETYSRAFKERTMSPDKGAAV